MSNKYSFRVPYSCTTYGNLSGVVWAENREEAMEIIENRGTDDDSYDDCDSDDYTYNYDETSIELEEGIEGDEEDSYNDDDSMPEVPSYFLEHILLI